MPKKKWTNEQNLLQAAYQIASCRLVMNLYLYYENACEDQALSARVQNYEDSFLQVLKEAQKGSFLTGTLDSLRQNVIRDMESLTAYTDRLQLYEYLINRTEYRFRPFPQEYESDPDHLCAKLMEEIKAAEDSTAGLLLMDIRSQLPIRMTRARFLDMLEQELKQIEAEAGADILYLLERLETAAGLAEPVCHPQWEEIDALTRKLAGYDWRKPDQAAFEEAENCLRLVTEKLTRETDSYILLQDLINALYVILLTREQGFPLPPEEETYENLLTRLVYGLEHDDEALNFEALDELLMSLEGIQEAAADTWEEASGDAFHKISLLLSGNLFTKLEDPSQKASDSSAAIHSFLSRLQTSLEKADKPLSRAMMAAVLAQMPPAAKDLEEVEELILNSLAACSDEGEKLGAMAVLNMIGQETDPET